MLFGFLALAAMGCAIQALRAKRLLASALWLAGVSASVALLMYLLGAIYAAVIELSVGTGLVTVLFTFAISTAGEDAMGGCALIPKPLAALLVVVAVVLLGALWLPLNAANAMDATSFQRVLWQDRALDVLVQLVLIFAGALGVLNLLPESNVIKPTTSVMRDERMEIPTKIRVKEKV